MAGSDAVFTRLAQRGVALLAPRMAELGHDPCGGSEVVLWEDAAILEKAGVPVRVYASAARNGAPVRRIPVRTRARLLTSLEYCWPFLQRERHAMVLAYNEPTVAGLAPQRAVVRFDWSTPLPRYWALPFWRTRFRRALYLFPSQNERELFRERHRAIPAEATVALPNAVDLDLFRPAALGAAPGRRVGFAGQWVERKGIAGLLEAWHHVRERIPAAQLWLAGGTELWRTKHAPVRSDAIVTSIRGMSERGLVHVAGTRPRNQMPAFWNSVDVAVVPSTYEAFGLVALEAMACGVPVVASRVGGLPEIIVDGKSGLLVTPGDAGELARALQTLLSDEPLRRRLAAGARRRAEQFSLEKRARGLLALLAARAEGAS